MVCCRKLWMGFKNYFYVTKPFYRNKKNVKIIEIAMTCLFFFKVLWSPSPAASLICVSKVFSKHLEYEPHIGAQLFGCVKCDTIYTTTVSVVVIEWCASGRVLDHSTYCLCKVSRYFWSRRLRLCNFRVSILTHSTFPNTRLLSYYRLLSVKMVLFIKIL